jgi:hypothetical protein
MAAADVALFGAEDAATIPHTGGAEIGGGIDGERQHPDWLFNRRATASKSGFG